MITNVLYPPDYPRVIPDFNVFLFLGGYEDN